MELGDFSLVCFVDNDVNSRTILFVISRQT